MTFPGSATALTSRSIRIPQCKFPSLQVFKWITCRIRKPDLKIMKTQKTSKKNIPARDPKQCCGVFFVGNRTNATLPIFRAMDTHHLRRGSHLEVRNRNFTTSISRDAHRRSPQRVALRNQKSQLYLHSVRWTRTISAEGYTSKSEDTTLPAFRAINTHDLRRGLHFEIRNNCNFSAFRTMDTHNLRRGLHFEIRKRNFTFTCIPWKTSWMESMAEGERGLRHRTTLQSFWSLGGGCMSTRTSWWRTEEHPRRGRTMRGIRKM